MDCGGPPFSGCGTPHIRALKLLQYLMGGSDGGRRTSCQVRWDFRGWHGVGNRQPVRSRGVIYWPQEVYDKPEPDVGPLVLWKERCDVM